MRKLNSSKLRMSGASFKTTQSSPERLVNIVCPSQQSTQKTGGNVRRARSALKQSLKQFCSFASTKGKETRPQFQSFKRSNQHKSNRNAHTVDRSNSSIEKVMKQESFPIQTPVRKKKRSLNARLSGSRSNSKSVSQKRL